MASGQHEGRVRVTFNLPRNNVDETEAILDVIDYLKGLREDSSGATGFTFSDLDQPVFKGFWWDEDQPVPDWIVMFYVDYLVTDVRTERMNLAKKVGELREKIKAAYAENDCGQKEVWIVSGRIMRYHDQDAKPTSEGPEASGEAI